MNGASENKPLKPEDLISKTDSELLQLKIFYEKKIDENKKFDIFKSQKNWLRNHKKQALYIFLGGMIILVISLYYGMTKNIIYSIPAMIVFTVFMFVGMMFDTSKTDVYYRNVDTLGLLLQVRIESEGQKKRKSTISKKAMAVYDTLKEGECNQAVLLKKLSDKGTPISEKTLRKYLENDLKDIIGEKNAPTESSSRSLKNTRVFFIKVGK
jgi:hypothetical protein